MAQVIVDPYSVEIKKKLLGGISLHYACPSCKEKLETKDEDAIKGDVCPTCSTKLKFDKKVLEAAKEVLLERQRGREAKQAKKEEAKKKKEELRQQQIAYEESLRIKDGQSKITCSNPGCRNVFWVKGQSGSCPRCLQGWTRLESPPQPPQKKSPQGIMLLDCPACGNTCSETAESCPKCGHKFRESDAKAAGKTIVWVLLWIFVITPFILGMLYSLLI